MTLLVVVIPDYTQYYNLLKIKYKKYNIINMTCNFTGHYPQCLHIMHS